MDVRGEQRGIKMGSTAYAQVYYGIDFRQEPEKYVIGRGEQGVLIAEPYKSEILAMGWNFRTKAIAETSSQKILKAFYAYLAEDDFVGADMARKFLQMGWTRARRYANHASGVKYAEGKIKPQEKDALTSEKAQAAAVFKKAYDEARTYQPYLKAKEKHKIIHQNFLKNKP